MAVHGGSRVEGRGGFPVTSTAGSVAIPGSGQKDLRAVRIGLCSEPLELLSERQVLSAGVFRLSLLHHVHHFNPAQDGASATHGLEPHHRVHSPLDGTVILLNAIVEVSTLSDADRLEFPPGSVLQPVCHIAAQDRFTVGLAAVDDDPLGPTMLLEGLTQKPLGRSEVSSSAEPELDRGVAMAVDGAVKTHPSAPDFDVSLIHVPFPVDASFAKIEALEQFGRVANNPPVDGRMVDRDAPLGHHLL